MKAMFWIIAAATAAITTVSAVAQDAAAVERNAQRRFEAADMNRDGKLDEAEVTAMIAARPAPPAKDGAEVPPPALRAKGWMKRVDTNGDNSVDLAEMIVMAKANAADRKAAN